MSQPTRRQPVAVSSSSSYGLVACLRLRSTPPRGAAVVVGFRAESVCLERTFASLVMPHLQARWNRRVDLSSPGVSPVRQSSGSRTDRLRQGYGESAEAPREGGSPAPRQWVPVQGALRAGIGRGAGLSSWRRTFVVTQGFVVAQDFRRGAGLSSWHRASSWRRTFVVAQDFRRDTGLRRGAGL